VAIFRWRPRRTSVATNSLLVRRAPTMKFHVAADSGSSATSLRKAEASR
jgi:hypothetical protein